MKGIFTISTERMEKGERYGDILIKRLKILTTDLTYMLSSDTSGEEIKNLELYGIDLRWEETNNFIDQEELNEIYKD